MVTVPAVHRQQVGSFLLPTKEVWGKVMFLHVSVIPSTGGGGLPPEGGLPTEGERVCLQWGGGLRTEKRGGLYRPPPKPEKWVVCILLECFLVTQNISQLFSLALCPW